MQTTISRLFLYHALIATIPNHLNLLQNLITTVHDFQLKGKHKTVDCLKCHKKETLNGKSSRNSGVCLSVIAPAATRILTRTSSDRIAVNVTMRLHSVQ